MPAQISDLQGVFQSFIRVAISLVGLVAIAMIVFGGIKYLTAGADKNSSAAAGHTITFGVVGLIIAVSSWIILGLVGTFLGVDFSTFSIALP